VGVGDGVTVGVEDAMGDGLGDGLGVGEIEGIILTVTPLLQTRLPFFFRHVNSRFLEMTTLPTFLQALPAFGDLADAPVGEVNIKHTERVRIRNRRINEV